MGIQGDDLAAGFCGLYFWYWSRLKRYKYERRPFIRLSGGRGDQGDGWSLVGVEFLMLAEAGEWTGGEASDALPEDSLDKPIINHPGKLIFKVPIFHEISELQSID